MQDRRIAAGLGIALAARVLVDLAPSVGFPGAPRWLSAIVLVGAGLAVLWARAWGPPGPAWGFAALLLLAAPRGIDPATWLALYLGPLVIWRAATAAAGEAWTWSIAVGTAAALPLAWDAVALAQGQPATFVLNGYPRLLGGYANPHTHAVALAVFASIGALWADAGAGRRRSAGIALFALASGFLLLTWVRTAMLLLGVQLVAWLILRGRGRWAAVLAVAAAIAVLAVPGLRDRFADVGRLLTGTPPPEGWGAIGSWRGHIWADAVRAFSEHGPWAWATGLGLGRHVGLHKDLDPHSDALSLLFQAGVLAPIAWYAALGAGARAAWRSVPDDPRQQALRAHGVAWALALALCAPISNDVLPRVTLTWWVFAVLGAAVTRPGRAGTGTPPG